VLGDGLRLFRRQQCGGCEGRQSDGVRAEGDHLLFQLRPTEQITPRFRRVVDDDVIRTVTSLKEQLADVGHALGIVGGKQKECQPHALFGTNFQDLQFLQCAQDERIGLRAGVDDVDGGGVLEHAAEQAEQLRLALLLVAQWIQPDNLGVAAGKGVMTIIKIGAVPRDAEAIKPGGTEFGLKALAKVAFGLRIQVNALRDVHNVEGSLRLMLIGFGCRNGRATGVAASRGLRCVVVAGRGEPCVLGEGASLSQWDRAQRLKYRR